MSKPAVVLVHGFCGGAAHWVRVIGELKRLGYDDLHAVENPLTSLADDAARTRKMIAQVNGPVVLVGHSYGGAVISEAGNLPNVAASSISPRSRRMPARAPAASPSSNRLRQSPMSRLTAMATCGSPPTSSAQASARIFPPTKRW